MVRGLRGLCLAIKLRLLIQKRLDLSQPLLHAHTRGKGSHFRPMGVGCLDETSEVHQPVCCGKHLHVGNSHPKRHWGGDVPVGIVVPGAEDGLCPGGGRAVPWMWSAWAGWGGWGVAAGFDRDGTLCAKQSCLKKEVRKMTESNRFLL